MKMLRLAYVNYKRLLKDINTLGFMLIMPLVIILVTNLALNREDKPIDVNIAFNIEDLGSYGEEMVDVLGINNFVFNNNQEAALDVLEKNEVLAVYTIPANFTEVIKRGDIPTIKSYKREEGNATLSSEILINDYINKRIKENILLRENLIDTREELYRNPIGISIETGKENNSFMDIGLLLTAMLIIYFTIFDASTISNEIQTLKNERVLSRAMSTANKDYKVIGGIYLSIVLLQITIGMILLMISKVFLGFDLVQLEIIIVNIMLASFIAIGLGLVVTRIAKNPGVSSITLTIITLATTFLSTMGIGSESNQGPWILENLAKFTPQYWMLDSLIEGSLFPNVIPPILMAIALFTGGSTKIKSFINKI